MFLSGIKKRPMSYTPRRLLFVCGGTGGHIYPALALCQHLKPDFSLFLTSTASKDTEILKRYGVSFSSITTSRRNPFLLLRGFVEAWAALKAFKPEIVVGTGGFVTGPVLLAAVCLRIPIVLLEQNVVPGRVTRFFHAIAALVCLSFEETLSYLAPTKQTYVTGNPVRQSYVRQTEYEDFFNTPLPALPVIVAFGGSQGAESLNRLLSNHYSYYTQQNMILIHITGKKHYDMYYSETPYHVMYNARLEPRIYIFPYVEDMAFLYQKASVVISRAGATTLAELLHYQKPAVLIPYPYAKDNHQVHNARAFERVGHGKMLEEKDLQFEMLQFHVNRLSRHVPEATPYPNAAEQIASHLERIFT